jgi:Family of unknown function (DUF6221)
VQLGAFVSDTVNDLIMWLRARLDEDDGRYRETVDTTSGWAEDSADLNEGYILGEARRALVEIEVKRRIVDACENAIEIGKIPPLASWSDDAAGAEVGRYVLCLMTLPYADRPDYQPEWSFKEAEGQISD